MSESAHAMILERTYPSGVEEWYCPTCGRRMIMRWPPFYQKIVLVPGDEHVIHDGLGHQPTRDAAEAHAWAADTTDLADEHLRPWLQWMYEAGLHR